MLFVKRCSDSQMQDDLEMQCLGSRDISLLPAGISALLVENSGCPPDPASGSFVIGFTAGEWLCIDPSA